MYIISFMYVINYKANKGIVVVVVVVVVVSGKLPTYPSPKQTLTLTSHFGQNDVLGEG